MVAISVVFGAPKGIAHCPAVEAFINQADGESLEVVVADGGMESTERSRFGLRHILAPGQSVFSLRGAAIAHASKDWIIVTEDHCRPMPGMLQAFRSAIENHPEIDLFCGALANQTSTSSWEWAYFLNFRFRHWQPAYGNPKRPTIGSLAVRRNSVLPSELRHEGGFEMLTIPRLSRSGRYGHCQEGVVDHIEHVEWGEALIRQFHSARASAYFARQLAPRSFGMLPLRIFAVPFNRIFVLPVVTLSAIWGTEQARWSLIPQLMLIGVFTSAGWVMGYFAGPGHSRMKVG